MVQFLRGVEVPVEIGHHSVTGALHGHTLIVQVWTPADVDLDAFKADVVRDLAFMEDGLLEDIVGRTFEDVARSVLSTIKSAVRVRVSLPSRGHAIEAWL
jgi:hypothetical protein